MQMAVGFCQIEFLFCFKSKMNNHRYLKLPLNVYIIIVYMVPIIKKYFDFFFQQ